MPDGDGKVSVNVYGARLPGYSDTTGKGDALRRSFSAPLLLCFSCVSAFSR